MVTTLALVSMLACAPAPIRVPLTTAACEGADLVRRNHDRIEVDRTVNACTVVRCEGTDRVRRSTAGWVISREPNACTVVRCEGWDRVVRTTSGWEVARAPQACTPVVPETVAVQTDVVRFGLSFR